MASCPCAVLKTQYKRWPVSLISALFTVILQRHAGELATIHKANSSLINAREKREGYTHLSSNAQYLTHELLLKVLTDHRENFILGDSTNLIVLKMTAEFSEYNKN